MNELVKRKLVEAVAIAREHGDDLSAAILSTVLGAGCVADHYEELGHLMHAFTIVSIAKLRGE